MKKLIIFSMIALIFTVSSITSNAGVNNYESKIDYIFRPITQSNEGSTLVAQSNMTNGSVFSFNFDFTNTPYYNQQTKIINYTDLFNDFKGITMGLANSSNGNLWNDSSFTNHIYISFIYTESQRRLDIDYIVYGYHNNQYFTSQSIQQDSIFLNFSQQSLYDSPPFFSISVNTNSDLTNGSRVRINMGRYFVDLSGNNANAWASSIDFLDSQAGTNHNLYIATSDYATNYYLDANRFYNGNIDLVIGYHYGDVVNYHSNIYSYYYNKGLFIGSEQDFTTLPTTFVSGLNDLLSINLGGVTLGALVLIPITIGIFSWFIKISRK
jgi:hypothetical protein